MGILALAQDACPHTGNHAVASSKLGSVAIVLNSNVVEAQTIAALAPATRVLDIGYWLPVPGPNMREFVAARITRWVAALRRRVSRPVNPLWVVSSSTQPRTAELLPDPSDETLAA